MVYLIHDICTLQYTHIYIFFQYRRTVFSFGGDVGNITYHHAYWWIRYKTSLLGRRSKMKCWRCCHFSPPLHRLQQRLTIAFFRSHQFKSNTLLIFCQFIRNSMNESEREKKKRKERLWHKPWNSPINLAGNYLIIYKFIELFFYSLTYRFIHLFIYLFINSLNYLST